MVSQAELGALRLPQPAFETKEALGQALPILGLSFGLLELFSVGLGGFELREQVFHLQGELGIELFLLKAEGFFVLKELLLLREKQFLLQKPVIRVLGSCQKLLEFSAQLLK